MDEVDKIVHKIVSGKLKMSRDERQIYANNAKEIEKRLEDLRKGAPNGKGAGC